jgi:hypothetical protein
MEEPQVHNVGSDRSKVYEAVAGEINRSLEGGRVLRAAFWAARYVVLTGQKFWPAEQEEAMVNALREQARERLAVYDDRGAVLPAAFHRMLTSSNPWLPSEEMRLVTAKAKEIEVVRSWRRATTAQIAVEYLLIAERTMWDAGQQDEMIAALADDFLVHFQRTDYLGAAELMTLYRLLSEGLPA